MIIILATFSYVTSLLLDFNFVSPYTTLQEDLAYVSDHIRNQEISSWAWLITAAITFIAVPFYVIIFSRRLRALHYFNGLCMLGASAGFVVMGMVGLEMHQTMLQNFTGGVGQVDEQLHFALLEQFSEEQFYNRIGSTFLGLFAIGLSLTKFRLGRFPLISTLLLILSGPTLIFFNWYNPDHVGKTIAMAGILIGLLVFCVRLINKGIST